MNKSLFRFIFIAFILIAAVAAGLWWNRTTPAPVTVDSSATTSNAAPASLAKDSPAAVAPPGEKQATGALLAPAAEKFDRVELQDRAVLLQYLSQAQHKQALSILEKQHCESPNITVYFKKDLAEKLLVSQCFYLVTDTGDEFVPPFYDPSYGIMLFVNKNGVFELKKVADFRLLYEFSKLTAVTNLHKNNRLQLWIDGLICENGALEEDDKQSTSQAASQATSQVASNPASTAEPEFTSGFKPGCFSTTIMEAVNGDVREYWK